MITRTKMSLFPAYKDDTKETFEKVRKVIYRIVLSADIKIKYIRLKPVLLDIRCEGPG